MSNLYSIHIGMNVCDEGLSIAHVGPIIIHGRSRIGKNLRVHVGVNIGANGGEPPVFGDNVYIGPNVCIVEDVHIGNNATIGAGSVVVKDVPEGATVAGVPAKVISYKEPGRFIKDRYVVEE